MGWNLIAKRETATCIRTAIYRYPDIPIWPEHCVEILEWVRALSSGGGGGGVFVYGLWHDTAEERMWRRYRARPRLGFSEYLNSRGRWKVNAARGCRRIPSTIIRWFASRFEVRRSEKERRWPGPTRRFPHPQNFASFCSPSRRLDISLPFPRNAASHHRSRLLRAPRLQPNGWDVYRSTRGNKTPQGHCALLPTRVVTLRTLYISLPLSFSLYFSFSASPPVHIKPLLHCIPIHMCTSFRYVLCVCAKINRDSYIFTFVLLSSARLRTCSNYLCVYKRKRTRKKKIIIRRNT